MPNIDEIVTSTSNYLKQADIPVKGVNVTIRGFRQEDLKDDSGQTERKAVLYFKELEKGLVMNIINRELLKDVTGTSETDEMKGQVVNLWNDKSVMFGTKRTGGIRIREKQAESQNKNDDEFNDSVPF